MTRQCGAAFLLLYIQIKKKAVTLEGTAFRYIIDNNDYFFTTPSGSTVLPYTSLSTWAIPA
jgi:hypothetical protein